MLLLFCQSPIDRKLPDDAYESEFAAAQSLNIGVQLIDFEALEIGDAERSVRFVQSNSSKVDAVYRGWMISPDKYKMLFQSLAVRGVNLINTPTQYKHCHYLPEWLKDIGVATPKTTVMQVSSENELSALRLTEVLASFGNDSVIVKDYVKSEKHYWHEACFIPDARNSEHALKVVKRFLELRGSNLEGGLVFRKFETFRQIGNHSKSKMPLTEEYRAFVLDGKIVSVMNYWDETDYPGSRPDGQAVLSMVSGVSSRFFTVDFARLDNGAWMVVELGDGQVSGLPDNADVMRFYQSLQESLRIGND